MSTKREALQNFLIKHTGVVDFLDTVELLVKAANRIDWGVGYGLLRGGSEEAFVIARFGYRFVGDDIVEAGTDVENQAIDQARDALLRDERFGDAEAKFVSALRKATSAREADYPEAVHAAVSAVEEVCRELLSEAKVTLEPGLNRLQRTHNLDPNAVGMLKKLYHLRGNLEGAAHGAGAGSEQVAKLAIHTAAAGMLYLIAECA